MSYTSDRSEADLSQRSSQMDDSVKYAINIVDQYDKELGRFIRGMSAANSQLTRMDGALAKVNRKRGPFDDQGKSIARMRHQMERYEVARDKSFRTDHIRKYNALIAETQRRIDRLTGVTAKAGQGSATAAQKAFKWGTALKTVAGGYLAIQAVGSARRYGIDSVMASAQVEKFNVTLKTMLGSTEAARDRMQEYFDVAKKTPFELNQVVSAGNQLQAIGRYSRDNLTMLGDLAAASGKPVEQVMNAYAKLSTGQKGEGVNMFRDLLISSEDWAKATGKGIKKNGELKASTEEMIAALPKIMRKKGFFGMMAQQARTTEGQISNLKDSLFQLKVAFGDRMKPATNSFIKGATATVDVLKDWVEIPLAQKIAKEKAELNALVGVITSANTGEETRSRLLAEMQQKYPEFLSGLDLETVKNEDLRKKLQEVNDEYERKIRLASMKKVSSQEQERLEELRNKGVRLQTYQMANNEVRSMESYFRNKGVEEIKDKDGHVTLSFSRALDMKFRQWSKRYAANPDDGQAQEFVDNYNKYKGWRRTLDENKSFWTSPAALKEKIAENQLQFEAQQRFVDKLNANVMNEERKTLLENARGVNLADGSTYKKLFGDKKLSGEFDSLRQTTFEKLNDEQWQRLADFMDGKLKAGSGILTVNPLGELQKQQDVITGGGRNVKNINITLESLIGENTNVFEPGQGPDDAEEFTDKLTHTLQGVLNDTNYN